MSPIRIITTRHSLCPRSHARCPITCFAARLPDRPIRTGRQRVFRVPRRRHGGVGAAYLPAVPCQRDPMLQRDNPTASRLAQACTALSPACICDSYSSSPKFTRPPSLAPSPPVAGRVHSRSSRIDCAACAGVHCPGALDGSLRNPPQPVGY